MRPGNILELDDALKHRIDELAQADGVQPLDIVRAAVEKLAATCNGSSALGDSESIWDEATRITGSVPPGEWEKLPTDLARNFDHHHYGHPKED